MSGAAARAGTSGPLPLPPPPDDDGDRGEDVVVASAKALPPNGADAPARVVGGAEELSGPPPKLPPTPAPTDPPAAPAEEEVVEGGGKGYGRAMGRRVSTARPRISDFAPPPAEPPRADGGAHKPAAAGETAAPPGMPGGWFSCAKR